MFMYIRFMIRYTVIIKGNMGVAVRRREAMRLPGNTCYNLLMFTNYVCICFHMLSQNKLSLSRAECAYIL